MDEKNCGRIDDHDEHRWRGHEQRDWWTGPSAIKRVWFTCKGAPVTEGGWRS
jgi:hypothetical protein